MGSQNDYPVISASETHLIPWKEIRQHTTRNSCWIVLKGEVYDVTRYLREHPGGSSIILENSGKECIELFQAIHPWINYKVLLKEYWIGVAEK